MPYHKKKTDRPPRGLNPEHTMKAAVDEVILGRAVNTVARERSRVKKRSVSPNPQKIATEHFFALTVLMGHVESQKKSLG